MIGLQRQKPWQQCKAAPTLPQVPELHFEGPQSERLVTFLRQWSGRILQQVGGEERQNCRLQLEDAVLRLDQIVKRSEYRKTHGEVGQGQGHRGPDRSHESLLNALCASMYLRDRGKLAETLDRTIKSLPGGGGLVKGLGPLADAPTISRSQISIDAALCCYFRQVFESDAWLLFLFADSSPQGGLDWLISMCRMIKLQDLRACVEAASILQQSVVTFRAASLEENFQRKTQERETQETLPSEADRPATGEASEASAQAEASSGPTVAPGEVLDFEERAAPPEKTGRGSGAAMTLRRKHPTGRKAPARSLAAGDVGSGRKTWHRPRLKLHQRRAGSAALKELLSG